MIAREVKHVWFVCLFVCVVAWLPAMILCVLNCIDITCVYFISLTLSLSYVLECLMIFVLLLLCDDKTDLNQEQLLNNTR